MNLYIIIPTLALSNYKNNSARNVEIVVGKYELFAVPPSVSTDLSVLIRISLKLIILLYSYSDKVLYRGKPTQG